VHEPLTIDAPDVQPLLAPDDHVRLGVARARGGAAITTGDCVAWVLVEGGRGCVTVRPRAQEALTVEVDGRRDVFEGPGWSVLLGRASDAAWDGDLAVTIVWRASDRELETRVIDAATVADEARGEGATARRVRTYVAEGPLIVGETLNPPGGWSSWPPHRHDHEEAYLYRFEPAHGFGVHVAYDERTGDQPVIVRDGSIERITDGWHPVVAAPGFTMYYLWALAGDTDTVDTRLDPRFA
jgi:5-deoxy-glucuronate isomerase